MKNAHIHTVRTGLSRALVALTTGTLVLLTATPRIVIAVDQQPSLLQDAAVLSTVASTPQMKQAATEKNEFPSSGERNPRFTRVVIATAYSSDPYQTDSTPCTPAMSRFDLCKHYEQTGIADTIATNCLPLGTQVRFPELYGDKVFTVRDRMNERYGCNRIDFWVGSVTPESREIIAEAKAKAKAFGVQRIEMEVFGRG